MTGRHREVDTEGSVAFTIDSGSERKLAMGCIWHLAGAGVSGLIGLLLAIAINGNSGPSNTEPAHPAPVRITQIPAGVISWRLPTPSP